MNIIFNTSTSEALQHSPILPKKNPETRINIKINLYIYAQKLNQTKYGD